LKTSFSKKKARQIGAAFFCTVGNKWVTVMDYVKFGFNDIIISLYTETILRKMVNQPIMLISISITLQLHQKPKSILSKTYFA